MVFSGKERLHLHGDDRQLVREAVAAAVVQYLKSLVANQIVRGCMIAAVFCDVMCTDASGFVAICYMFLLGSF